MDTSFLIDSHCHLDCLPPTEDLTQVIANSCSQGVCSWIVPGVTPAAWPKIMGMAESIPGVYPAPGVHPLSADIWNPTVAAELRRLAKSSVAIGEIGLDYASEAVDRRQQQQVFRAQLAIARENELPVVIHCRRAFADLLTIGKAENIGKFGGIVHAFSGSLEIARECIALGLLIGVAGPVTYTNAVRLPSVVASIGLQHVALETDSPDMTPEPRRGEGNRPENLPIIAQKIADLCATTIAEVAAATTDNVRKMLRFPRCSLTERR